MNKGLILEIKEKEVTVLTNDGSFITVKKSLAQGLDIGEEITFPRSTGLFKQAFPKNWLIPVLAAVACFMLILSVLIGNPFMFKEEAVFAYVHMDINPSLELGLNKQLEVVKLTGLNKAGEALLLSYDNIPGQKLDEVTIQLLELAAKQGYFEENNDVLIATSFTEEENEEYVQAIDLALDQVDTYLHEGASSVVAQETSPNQSQASTTQAQGGTQTAPDNQAGEQGVMELNSGNIVESSTQPAKSVVTRDIAIHRLQTDAVLRSEAKEKGISPGKYTLYLQAKENGIISEVEEIKDKSVSDLAKELGGLGSLRSNSAKNNSKQTQDKGKNGRKDNLEPEENKNKNKTNNKNNGNGNRGNNNQNNNGKKESNQQDNKSRNKQDNKNSNKQDNREKRPPGLEKKNEKEQEKEKEKKKGEEKRDRPGKREELPPNRSNNQGLPPGQAKKQGEDRLPPGQAKKEGTPRIKEPPGQSKKQNGTQKAPDWEKRKQEKD